LPEKHFHSEGSNLVQSNRGDELKKKLLHGVTRCLCVSFLFNWLVYALCE